MKAIKPILVIYFPMASIPNKEVAQGLIDGVKQATNDEYHILVSASSEVIKAPKLELFSPYDKNIKTPPANIRKEITKAIK